MKIHNLAVNTDDNRFLVELKCEGQPEISAFREITETGPVSLIEGVFDVQAGMLRLKVLLPKQVVLSEDDKDGNPVVEEHNGSKVVFTAGGGGQDMAEAVQEKIEETPPSGALRFEGEGATSLGKKHKNVDRGVPTVRFPPVVPGGEKLRGSCADLDASWQGDYHG